MMNTKTPDEIIPWSHEMTVLEETYTAEKIKMQASHWKNAMETIAVILYKMYGKVSITSLVENANQKDTIVKFCDHMTQYTLKYAYSTKHMIASNIKKIFQNIDLPSEFVKRIKILPEAKKNNENDDYNSCVLADYKNLETNHPTRIMLSEWINILKDVTRTKKPESVKIQVIFWKKILKSLGQTFETFDKNKLIKNVNPIKKAIQISLDVDLKLPLNRKAAYGRIFFVNIMGFDIPKTMWKVSNDKVETLEQDIGQDKHRISAIELECIHSAACENQRDELIFMLLITTGMRIGGLANLKIENICDVVGKDIVIKERGVTLEKFSKWFSFVISPKVSTLLINWIKYSREASKSPYLFPGKTSEDHLSTHHLRECFNNIIKRSGLVGKHLHPHALRHSFAHMLLESGNDIECVSKIMGHSSSKTTSQFYLKESAAEATARANIPWLVKNDNKKKIIPDFLLVPKSIEKTNEKKRASRHKKVRIITEINQSIQTSLKSSSTPDKSDKLPPSDP